MSDETRTGKLTFAEFETLANLLRRFEVHHTAGKPKMVKAIVADTWLAVENVFCDLYVPNVPMTAGPDPIPVSELLNQSSVEDAAGLLPWRSS